ncbi:MAG: iron uptake porin [Coleofasciculus sp. G1-WW12-02]|uniref:iron uptake porin n=1 Tax=Coleofasciculus sp. G1-WW12-02 TaxID=3068483 RepID=UPI0032F30019
MAKTWWNTLVVNPVVLGGTWAVCVTPNALAQIEGYNPISQANTLEQVTSVSQLRDVSPGDWAYEALRSLVERYGCIAGYPDGTYRGNRALTRFEFAAGLNACLQQIERLLPNGELEGSDLPTLRRLVQEFEAELATLGARVDNLEGRVAFLEDNQFSTTTKLRGEVSFALSSVFGDEKADGSGEDLEDEVVFDNRVRLFLETSFTGEDLLLTRLDALNTVPFGPGEGDNPNITGTSMTRLAFDEGNNNDVAIGKLFYRFSLGEMAASHNEEEEEEEHGHGHGHGAVKGAKLSFIIDAVGGEFNENFANYNEFFSEELTGAISRFGRFNPIYYQGLEGTGASLTYNLNSALNLSLGYLAPNANDPSQKNGLFNGSYAAIAQLGIEPSEGLRLGLTYVRSYYPGGQVVVSGETGSELANVPFGEDTATSADQFGLSASLRLSRAFTLSGWGGLTLAHAQDNGFNNGVLVDEGDDATIFNWAITLALPDFGSEGSLLGFVVGQPPKVTDNDGGFEDDDTSWHLEAQYRYQLTDNIAINPGVFVILNPEHYDNNDTIWVGTLRTIFEF